jgi:hypothetical protein
MENKEYTGSAYIGVVGPEQDFSQAWRSIAKITRRAGDSEPQFFQGTKGYEMRQHHINKWMDDTSHPFCLLLDHDMIFCGANINR